MAAQSALDAQATTAIMQRIAAARQDRAHFAGTYNAFLDLARPWRPRVQQTVDMSTPRAPGEQDDIFDTTLQDVVDDFASDTNDEFTPSYKPWTKHVPTEDIQGTGAKRQVQDYADGRMRRLYDSIRASNFEEASQEMWIDMAVAPSAMMIGYAPPGNPIPVEHVPMHELLISPGPFGGVDDRWRERAILVRHLDTLWPQIDWSDYGPTKEERARSKAVAVVIDGGFRDWSKPTETWHWHVISKNKVLRRRVYTGAGSCPMIVGRTNVSAPSAYGVGPAGKAIPPARVLNEMSYLFLKREGRILNPAVIFYDDGTLNPEGGIGDGDWIPATADFKIQELRPDSTNREPFYTQEDLRMMVKRALFQDKPYQRGDTPPTAAQWLGEEAMAARRKSFPRARIHAEVVLPAIRRYEWLMARRGEIEPLRIEGTLVNIEPVSPLSKSADIEEAQIAVQFLSGIGGVMPQALTRIDESFTLNAIKDKMGAALVKVLTDEQYAQKQQDLLATAQESEARLSLRA